MNFQSVNEYFYKQESLKMHLIRNKKLTQRKNKSSDNKDNFEKQKWKDLVN